MLRQTGVAIAMLQFSACGGELPPEPKGTVTPAPLAMARTSGGMAAVRSPPAIPTISIVGEKFCVTSASYLTEHLGLDYPTTETACDYSQQRVVIHCPGGCMAAQGIRYAIQALPVGILYSPCSGKKPSFEPGNYNVDARTGSYFIYLSGYSSKHYDTANPVICKDVGQTLLLGFTVKRILDGSVTPLHVQLSMLP